MIKVIIICPSNPDSVVMTRNVIPSYMLPLGRDAEPLLNYMTYQIRNTFKNMLLLVDSDWYDFMSDLTGFMCLGFDDLDSEAYLYLRELDSDVLLLDIRRFPVGVGPNEWREFKDSFLLNRNSPVSKLICKTYNNAQPLIESRVMFLTRVGIKLVTRDKNIFDNVPKNVSREFLSVSDVRDLTSLLGYYETLKDVHHNSVASEIYSGMLRAPVDAFKRFESYGESWIDCRDININKFWKLNHNGITLRHLMESANA